MVNSSPPAAPSLARLDDRPSLRRWAPLLLVWGLAGCSKATADVVQHAESSVEVRTVTAAKHPVPRMVRLTGALVGVDETNLAANASGRIVEAHVERGSEVKKGEVLLRLDTRAQSLDAAEARANLESLSARQANQARECDRAEELFRSGAIAKAELERARLTCDASPAERRAAEARADLSLLALSDGAVKAPFAGFVTARHVRVGEYVRADTSVVSLVNLDRLRLEVSVPEVMVGAMSERATLRFSVPAYPDRHFSASLRTVGREVRPAARDVVVDADVGNPDHALLPGMFASVDVPLAAEPTVVVPKSAVIVRDGLSRAFVVREGRIEERVVDRGLEVAEGVAVLSGIGEGERVVEAPSPEVKNGRSTL